MEFPADLIITSRTRIDVHNLFWIIKPVTNKKEDFSSFLLKLLLQLQIHFIQFLVLLRHTSGFLIYIL